MTTQKELRSLNRGQAARSGAAASRMYRGIAEAASSYQKYKKQEALQAQAAAGRESPSEKTMRDMITKEAQAAANRGDMEMLRDMAPQLQKYYGVEGYEHFETLGSKHFDPEQRAQHDFKNMVTSFLYPERAAQRQAQAPVGSPVAGYGTDPLQTDQIPEEAPLAPRDENAIIREKISGLMTDDFKSRQLVKLMTGADPGPHALMVKDWLADFAEDRKENPNKSIAQAINDTAINYEGYVPAEVQNFRDIKPEDNKELSQIYANTLLGNIDFLRQAQRLHPNMDIGQAAHIEALNQLVREERPLPDKYQELHSIVSGYSDIAMEQKGKEIRNEAFQKALGVEAGEKVTAGPKLERKLEETAALSRQELDLQEDQARRQYQVEQYLGQTRIGETTAKSLAQSISVMKNSSTTADSILDAIKLPDGSVDISQLPVGWGGKGWAIHLASKMGIKPNKLQAQVRAQLAEMVRSAYETTGANTTKIEMEKIVNPTVAAINESPQLFIDKYSAFQRRYKDAIVEHLGALKAANKDLSGYDQKVLEAAENMTILDEGVKAASGIPKQVQTLLKNNPGKAVRGGGFIWLQTPEGIKKARIPEEN